MNAPANAAPLNAARAQVSHADSAAEVPQALMQIMMGAWVSQIAGTLARLRVFDEIARGHTSAAAIARQLSVNPSALSRALRAATMIGLVRTAGPNAFELTAQGELLRSDVPGSMRALLDAETAPGHWLPWGATRGLHPYRRKRRAGNVGVPEHLGLLRNQRGRRQGVLTGNVRNLWHGHWCRQRGMETTNGPPRR